LLSRSPSFSIIDRCLYFEESPFVSPSQRIHWLDKIFLPPFPPSFPLLLSTLHSQAEDFSVPVSRCPSSFLRLQHLVTLLMPFPGFLGCLMEQITLDKMWFLVPFFQCGFGTLLLLLAFPFLCNQIIRVVQTCPSDLLFSPY